MLELRAVGKFPSDEEGLVLKFMEPLPREGRKYLGMRDPSDVKDAIQAAVEWARLEDIGDGDFS